MVLGSNPSGPTSKIKARAGARAARLSGGGRFYAKGANGTEGTNPRGRAGEALGRELRTPACAWVVIVIRVGHGWRREADERMGAVRGARRGRR